MNIVLMDDERPVIIGSGAIGTAPAPDVIRRNTFFLETGDPLYPNGRLYQYKYTFKNNGIDSISLGRPPALINLLQPINNGFKVNTVYKRTTNSWNNIVSLGTTSVNANRQFYLGTSNTNNAWNLVVGGAASPRIDNSIQPINVYEKIMVDVPYSGNSTVYTSKGVFDAAGRGNVVDLVSPITIGSVADLSDNIEGNIEYVEFRDINNNLVDRLDFNDDVQWANQTTWAGNPFTIIDGAPTGVRVVDLVPYQW